MEKIALRCSHRSICVILLGLSCRPAHPSLHYRPVCKIKFHASLYFFLPGALSTSHWKVGNWSLGGWVGGWGGGNAINEGKNLFAI